MLATFGMLTKLLIFSMGHGINQDCSFDTQLAWWTDSRTFHEMIEMGEAATVIGSDGIIGEAIIQY